MMREPMMQTQLPEKDERIQQAITEALKRNEATNLDALNAAMIVLVKCLRLYPLGMREAHTDAAIKSIVEATFAECLEKDGPEARA